MGTVFLKIMRTKMYSFVRSTSNHVVILVLVFARSFVCAQTESDLPQGAIAQIASPTSLPKNEPSHTIIALDFAADNETILSANKIGGVHLWNSEGDHLKQIRKADNQILTCATTIPRRDFVMYSGQPPSFGIFQLKSGKRSMFDFGTTNSIRQFSLSQDTRFIAFTDNQNDQIVISKLDWEKHKANQVFSIPTDGSKIRYIKFSPDAKMIAAVDYENKIWIIRNRNKGAKSSYSEIQPENILTAHNKRISGVAFLGGSDVLASSDWDGRIILWDTKSGGILGSLSDGKIAIVSLAASQDGYKLFTGGMGTKVKVWDIPTGAKVATISGHDKMVDSIAVSPDQSKLASGGTDRTGYVWDLKLVANNNISWEETNAIRSKEVIDEKDIESRIAWLWEVYLSGEPDQVFKAERELAGLSDDTVTYLREKYKPVVLKDDFSKQVERWISLLDHEDYKTREGATRQLIQLGKQIQNTLELHQNKEHSFETGKRIQRVLNSMSLMDPPIVRIQETLTSVKVIAMLQLIHTEEALAHIQELSMGSNHSRLTREAQKALRINQVFSK
jgi:hypothetical protein